MLLDDPKKAVINVSKPIILATFVESLYSIVDSIWVSGLGDKALAAIGASFPILISIYAISWGFGIAVSSAISRRIGEGNLKLANKTAFHGLLLAVILGILYTLLIYPNLSIIFDLMHVSGDTKILAINYLKPLTLSAVLFNICDVLYGIFRGEGRTKVVMIASVIATVSNIILDPILIYIFKLNIIGASLATIMAIFIAIFILTANLRKSRIKIILSKINLEIIKDLLRVGLPSSLIDFTVAIEFFIITSIIMSITSAEDLAIFTGALRITDFGFIPMLGLASGACSVIGANYGAKRFENVKIAYLYTIKIGTVMEFLIILFIILLSPYLAYLFTYTKASYIIYNKLVLSLKILPWYLLFTPMILTTGALFQALGRGELSLLVSIFRSSSHIIFIYILSAILCLKIFGVFLGFIFAEMFSGFCALMFGYYVTKRLKI
ncbi:hypothetical protein J422_01056 [Methanocaldococcus villosus KIN24-T80]|uniref:MATE efflux family protein n=1 Tax=Methanocaldococcus villosus KIN24-T80 TaxID=1069083 RepID=N6UWE8_9EURY|nr:MATE family efflux transporter [Methanocaldococcus villosus]ENN96639.1 hypothetical protein J422_01056 [Methanocaldococcus villosus KIN24-T80]